jgi:hypothetical protein
MSKSTSNTSSTTCSDTSCLITVAVVIVATASAGATRPIHIHGATGIQVFDPSTGVIGSATNTAGAVGSLDGARPLNN